MHWSHVMIFSEDTEIAKSIPARIASYFVSLLDAGMPNRMACSILSPVGALSVKPTPAPVCLEAPSTLRNHQSMLPGFAHCCRISARKSANICPFNAKRGLCWILKSLRSIAYRVILPDKSGLCIVLRTRRLVITTIRCAWK